MKKLLFSIALHVFVVSGCNGTPSVPDPAFASVDVQMQALGLRLSYDLVDGHYTVYAKDASDQTISKAVEHLKVLWQGTSVTELDHERRFVFFLSGTDVTDDSIAAINDLQVIEVRLDGTKVTEECLSILGGAPHLRILVVGESQFSEEALHRFSVARPKVTMVKEK